LGARLFQIRDPDGIAVVFLERISVGHTRMKHIIVGISSASGVIYGVPHFRSNTLAIVFSVGTETMP
jgi:hypothetical protein